jgi:hypothetical protein
MDDASVPRRILLTDVQRAALLGSPPTIPPCSSTSPCPTTIAG